MSSGKRTLSAAISVALISGPITAGPSEPVVPEVSKQGLRVNGTREFEQFGASASGVGDFNGDGFADFAVGLVRPEPIGGTRARSTQVIFGGGGSTPVSADDISGRGMTISRPAGPGYVGDSVSGAGDVNGDGLSDLIVTANLIEPSISNTRTAFVVYGKPTSDDINLDELGAGGFRINIAEGFGTDGVEVSGVGDVNGDGLDDIAVGFRRAGTETAAGTGRVYVVFGSADQGTVDVENLGSRGFIVDGAGEAEQLGFSLSGAGDVNGDGLDDIVIGVPTYDRPGLEGSGKTVVIFGDQSNEDVDISNLNGRGFQVLGVASEDFSGIEVAGLGDVNGDGFSDVGIGSILRFGAQRTTPEAYVVFGSRAPSDLDLAVPGSQWLRIVGTESDAFFGQRISAAGDINGDGFADILIGAERAPFSDYGNGRAFVIYGTPNATLVDLNVQADAGFLFSGETDEVLGSEVSAAGDLNGDGLNDMLLGAYGVVFESVTGAGAVFVPYNANAQSNSATYLLQTRSGDAPKQGVGSLGDRSNHNFPAAGIWLDFSGGEAVAGAASTSTVTVDRLPDDAGLLPAGPQWRVQTDRQNWTSLEVELRLIGDGSPNFPSPALAVFFSPDGLAPFSPLESALDFDRNTISAQLNAEGFVRIGLRDLVFASGFEPD